MTDKKRLKIYDNAIWVCLIVLIVGVMAIPHLQHSVQKVIGIVLILFATANLILYWFKGRLEMTSPELLAESAKKRVEKATKELARAKEILENQKK